MLTMAALGTVLMAPSASAAPPIYHLTDLGLSGGTQSLGYGINDIGQIVGVTLIGPGYHGFRSTAIGAPAAVTDLGTQGGSNTQAYAINNSGQVTGQADGLGNTVSHAFRTSSNGLVSDPGADLSTLGGKVSVGNGINDSGQVAGTSNVSFNNPIEHAFRTSATGGVGDRDNQNISTTDLGVLAGGTSSYGRGINAVGQATGYSTLTGGNTHVFRTTATGKISDAGADLGTLGGFNAYGYAINDSGQVAGAGDTPTGSRVHAFRSSANGAPVVLTDLGTFGGLNSLAMGINNAGVVVGYSNLPGNRETHAFYYDTALYDLNNYLDASGAGWVVNQGQHINSEGDIAAFAVLNNQLHSVRLTSGAVAVTPEPGAWGLLTSLGLAAVGFLRRRRVR